MQSIIPGHRVDSPDYGAESSFPERHLDHDKAPFSGIGPDRYQTDAAKRQMFEPGLAPLSSQRWPSHSQPFLDYTAAQLHSHGQRIEHNGHPAPSQQTAVPLQTDWALFREQSSAGPLWQTTHSEVAVEDDSDSIQSFNTNPEKYSQPLSTLSSAQKPRRRSSRGITKPTKTPARSHPAAPRTERPYIPDFDYNTDWLDPLHSAASFLEYLPQLNHDGSVSTGTEIEVTYGDSSSSSKVDSKRIAHKLSEKTRRNRLTIAIREIQKLLPSEGDDREQSPSQSQKGVDYLIRPGVPSSKLDVVEMAVGYIKDLKARNKAMVRRLREVEQRLEGCQCSGGGGDAVMVSASSPSASGDTAG